MEDIASISIILLSEFVCVTAHDPARSQLRQDMKICICFYVKNTYQSYFYDVQCMQALQALQFTNLDIFCHISFPFSSSSPSSLPPSSSSSCSSSDDPNISFMIFSTSSVLSCSTCNVIWITWSIYSICAWCVNKYILTMFRFLYFNVVFT